MLSPSQYGTVTPPDLIGSTFTVNDFSSTFRIRHCNPLKTKTLPDSPKSPTNRWSNVPIIFLPTESKTLNLRMFGIVERFSK